eukprot:TRINITY_DN70467_c0_g1_i1.p1 TRINITY_DN70467_c0_g1~~TRINITY_DN70467_c0_g1_i1.p1  ORF type:complete len:192 (-),score=32.57 TRINITY_DN70467_c0_g1_i1:157-732(-)
MGILRDLFLADHHDLSSNAVPQVDDGAHMGAMATTKVLYHPHSRAQTATSFIWGLLFRGPDTGPSTAGYVSSDGEYYSPYYAPPGQAAVKRMQFLRDKVQALEEYPALPGNCEALPQGWVPQFSKVRKDAHCYWGNSDVMPGDFPKPPKPPPAERPTASSEELGSVEIQPWAPGAPPQPRYKGYSLPETIW